MVFGDVVYVGVASQEEVFALAPFFGLAYSCCTFRGSVVALDANSGKLLWKTYTMPDNGGQPGGYSGGPVWTDNGDIHWSTQVGPGGGTGGMQWGTATDGRRIYAAISNSNFMPYTLVPGGEQISWGAWSALDAVTGKLIWQTADPSSGATDAGSVSVANGLVYAGSSSGFMYALDAATGKILWSFDSGGSVVDGPSIVDGVLYWGSGYGPDKATPGIANNKLYAFSLKPTR